MTFLWHAALCTCEVYGAIALTVTFLLLGLVCLKAVQARKQERARFDAGLRAILREDAR